MQGRKNYAEKLFLSFQLSDRIPKENLYGRFRETLDPGFLYKDTKELYGRTGNPSIDPVVFFKLLITGYLEDLPTGRQEYLKKGGRKPSIRILKTITEAFQGYLTIFYLQIRPRPVLQEAR